MTYSFFRFLRDFSNLQKIFLPKIILDDFFNLKSECEGRQKKHPAGAFLGLPTGSPILYLILCEQQEDLKCPQTQVVSTKKRIFAVG